MRLTACELVRTTPGGVDGIGRNGFVIEPLRYRRGNSSQAHKLSRSQAVSYGFTLIELLVVIIVLGLLAGLVAPQILGRVSEARTKTAKTQIELIGVALDNYRLDNGSYPSTEQGLEALVVKPTRSPLPLNWRGPYLRKALPRDPWDRAYIYRSPGEHFPTAYDLSTLGRDGTPGGEDEDADVVSW